MNSLATSRLSEITTPSQSWNKAQNIICEDDDDTYYTTTSSWIKKENQLQFGNAQKSNQRNIKKI